MEKLLCATGNNVKFGIGKHTCATFGIELEQVVIDIDEIQGEDPEAIIRDKAQKAYAALGQPVVVTDDAWTIPGLNGFPGPYMKSINYWFTPDDFIRLTRDLADRRIILSQLVAYQDDKEAVVFRGDIPCTLSREARGVSGTPLMKIIILDGDNGLTISETYDAGKEHDPERLDRRSNSWKELGAWFKEKSAA